MFSGKKITSLGVRWFNISSSGPCIIFVMAYYEEKLKISGYVESPTFKPLKTASASSKHLTLWENIQILYLKLAYNGLLKLLGCAPLSILFVTRWLSPCRRKTTTMWCPKVGEGGQHQTSWQAAPLQRKVPLHCWTLVPKSSPLQQPTLYSQVRLTSVWTVCWNNVTDSVFILGTCF